MSDGIVPALEFGYATADLVTAPGDAPPANGLPGSSRARRTLDLRRTEAPGVGEMPGGQRQNRQRRRYAVALLDSDGRLTDQQLFSQLGWTPGMRVDIGVGDGHEIVVRGDEEGAWTLTARNMVLVPAPLRRWCGYGAGDPVLLVAVPSMSAVVVHALQTLDQALPDPRTIVGRMRPAGVPLGDAVATMATTADDCGHDELSCGRGSGDGAAGRASSGGRHG
ncbi:hypothetical protein ABZ345_02720 [Lentzea sp. NPDC005914]|uniref:hypothetical protein n=1 Tax=Lentzea sp. NPDC005914 TaxID=3154572 RepID=UPI0033CDD9E9